MKRHGLSVGISLLAALNFSTTQAAPTSGAYTTDPENSYVQD
jgi:hypothetical protein